jgi:predicted O-methyltransferase YrrM
MTWRLLYNSKRQFYLDKKQQHVIRMSGIKSSVYRRVNFVLTALGVRKKGFYTPYNYLDSIISDAPPFQEVYDLLKGCKPLFNDFLSIMNSHELHYINSRSGDITPNWSSSFLSRLDAACIYSAVAHFKPERIVEIGSGNSTMFMSRAIVDHGLGTKMRCIDPQPRIDIDKLPVTIDRRVLSLEDVAEIATLNAGDILFVDSSHILQPDFDVDIILNRIMPRLAPGVLVHFHDIFLPFPYPTSWKAYRFSEQNGLISWLLNGAVEPIFSAHFVWREMQAELNSVSKAFPLNTAANGGSLWLRMKAR